MLILLSEVKISDENNELYFYANEIEITNSWLDRLFGPLKEFFDTTESVNNYVISNPEFTMKLDNDAQSNNEKINNNKDANNEDRRYCVRILEQIFIERKANSY